MVRNDCRYTSCPSGTISKATVKSCDILPALTIPHLVLVAIVTHHLKETISITNEKKTKPQLANATFLDVTIAHTICIATMCNGCQKLNGTGEVKPEFQAMHGFVVLLELNT